MPIDVLMSMSAFSFSLIRDEQLQETILSTKSRIFIPSLFRTFAEKVYQCLQSLKFGSLLQTQLLTPHVDSASETPQCLSPSPQPPPVPAPSLEH